MVRKSVHIAGLANHVEALGYLCIFFAHLERRVNELLGQLTGLRDDPLRCVTNHVDFPKKLVIAKNLGFLKKPSQQWYDDADLLLWGIENHVIPKRNRFVHDGWLIGAASGEALRRYHRTRIEPGGAGEPLTLSTIEYVPTSAAEIWSVVDDATILSTGIDWLSLDLKASKPESSLPQWYRDHWSARRKPPKATTSKAPASRARSKRGE